jgi:hypothetical protein
MIPNSKFSSDIYFWCNLEQLFKKTTKKKKKKSFFVFIIIYFSKFNFFFILPLKKMHLINLTVVYKFTQLFMKIKIPYNVEFDSIWNVFIELMIVFLEWIAVLI